MSGSLHPQRQPGDRLLTQVSHRHRRPPTPRGLFFRRMTLTMAKLALPLLALALLASIAVWPEIARLTDQTRISFRRVMSAEPDSGRMLDPHYHGVDERGRPYTLTANWADQAAQGRINMGEPKGDLTLENGSWLMIRAKDGVYMQHTGQLDLTTDVVLYRDDGVVMRTQTASVDVKQGAASSDDRTHAEGPFGVLDAQGFMLTDKGTAIQFQGPARLILNGASK